VFERVKELVILRLKIMSREKELISKTYFHLLLPQNFKVASRCLYKAVDQIWFVAGDNSTDFNFYSKRAILASIYSMVMLHYVNNNNLDQTIELLNKQLKRVSKIPKIKNRLGDITKTISQIFKLVKNIRPIKQ
jgi:ubiquinone biosynthesis protein COQ9